MNIEAAEKYILNRLENELPKNLFYHGLHHTLDVTEKAIQIAKNEQVISKTDLDLLKTAALFHDAGFIYIYQGHEEEGCRIAMDILPQFEYSPKQIEQICKMIRATKVPQKPTNQLSKILCDADLDYLGRADYEPIAETLFQELQSIGVKFDHEIWCKKQIEFLENHQYWTHSQQKLREPNKKKQIERLLSETEKYASNK